MLIQKSPKQNIQYINAEATFTALEQAKLKARPFVGSMFWREVSGKKYLMRWTPPDNQKSLGPLSAENANAVDKFQKSKQEAEGRVKSLTDELDIHKRMNKALRVGRVPDVVVATLNAIRDAGLEDHFIVIGTHAIFAYETAAGVMFPSDGLATEDIDFLLDTRKQVKFLTQIKRLDTSFLEVLQKADKSFQMMEGQLYTAVNDKGFQVDVVRRMAGDTDPHPMRLSDKEDDFWAVQIPSGEKLLGARPFEQVVVSQSGNMARMMTVHPLDFVRIKQALGKSSTRDPLKAPKDLLQARLVTEMVRDYLPHLQEAHEVDPQAIQDRVDALPQLAKAAGAAYAFGQLAQQAIRFAKGDADAVDWLQVEEATIQASIGEHGQDPDKVLAALCQHSPGATSVARQEELKAFIQEVAPALQAGFGSHGKQYGRET